MFSLLQGMDSTIQELHPFMPAHVHQQGVQLSPVLVARYK